MKTSLVSVLGVLGLAGAAGGNVTGDLVKSEDIRQERIAQSPQFKDGKVISNIVKVDTDQGMAKLMWRFFAERSQMKPAKALPYHTVDTAALATPSDALRVTWLGHSSLFVEVDRTRILIDPVFDYAAPAAFAGLFKRNVEAPVAREDLPLPDVIVISHDHYDHLEESTARYFADQGVRFLVPLGVGRHLEGWGIDPNLIDELDWWEHKEINSVTLTAAPVNHNSGRGLFDTNKTLWASWAIQADSGSVFYSGDTAYGGHFTEIGERLGPFDLSFIEVAANVKDGEGYPVEGWGHMQASHTMQAHLDVRAEKLFPVHWSTYELFLHRWDEPVNDLIEEANTHGATLVTPMVGDSLDFSQAIMTDYWWKKLNQPEQSLVMNQAE
ncbi:MBL fold metallo-hydrolase [Photobacterium swingsii]|uniref:MBL fold metallo-hydrolase n=1 Tax=Photobacterium swingsii TaxID=680026 RepID=UPI00352E3C89